jgi:hypothetical protein
MQPLKPAFSIEGFFEPVFRVFAIMKPFKPLITKYRGYRGYRGYMVASPLYPYVTIDDEVLVTIVT